VSALVVRAGEPDDLPAITAIYNHYVLTSPATFDLAEFTVAERREWFGHYAARGAHRILVAAEDARVVGYATSSGLRPKPAYATSVETSVYVDAAAGSRGIGTRLYAALFEALGALDLHRAYAGITMPNPASVALHQRFGFAPLGVYREVGRKFGRYWDVEWFERALP
jgi:phosphinothricin acetyltransferase